MTKAFDCFNDFGKGCKRLFMGNNHIKCTEDKYYSNT